MQNIINTIKYRVITTFFVVASVAISIVPSAVLADDDWSYTPTTDYYSSGSSYDYSYTPTTDYYSSGYDYSYTPTTDYYSSGYDYSYTPTTDYYSSGYDYSYTPTTDYYSSGYDYAYTPTTDYYSNPSYYNQYGTNTYGYSTGYFPQSYGSSAGYMPYSNGGGYSGGGYGGGSNGSFSFLSNKTNTNYSYTNTTTNTNNTCAGQGNCNTVTNQVAQNTNDLTGTCPTSGTYNLNQTVNWTANATGGNGTYTYTWSGDVTGSGSNVGSTYNTVGTKNANVVITSNGQSITRNCSVQIINNQTINTLNGYCVANVSNSQIGQTVTFNAYANGGNNNNYFYQWSGDVYGNGQTISQNFNTGGTKIATVQITDGSGQSVTRTCNVFVNNNNNNNSNITLVSNGTNTPTTGTLASGVFLSDIPYTGVAENLKMILFVLGMTLWSAFMAWVVMKRKATKLGMTQREMIEKFKKENLLKKQITA